LRFAEPIIFSRVKTSAFPQIHNFSPYIYKFKMFSFQFKGQIKGTVPRDFRLQVFFMNQFPPSH
jgi:hypothetical protein